MKGTCDGGECSFVFEFVFEIVRMCWCLCEYVRTLTGSRPQCESSHPLFFFLSFSFYLFPLHLLNLFSLYLSLSLCSNESPPLFANDVLQHWTMVKLVLLQIVADVFVDVGHILGATADTMLDTE